MKTDPSITNILAKYYQNLPPSSQVQFENAVVAEIAEKRHENDTNGQRLRPFSAEYLLHPLRRHLVRFFSHSNKFPISFYTRSTKTESVITLCEINIHSRRMGECRCSTTTHR